ncbi:MAG: tRNA (adenosine(37)-N6)-threonylcarbamoyltransferase complex dimerization subunit type 1 TsaB [Candidatus Omnitrophota bacterium]|nr:tRNA (adenosine(37)-N6)-threonylcarbamoyltransferase complex dimerization subunit type 1 TsaB [Candidatus Omnitrophota bacterium]
MKILSIDTSIGQALNLSISDNLNIISKEKIDFVEDLSEETVPAIKRLLGKVNLSINSIDGFAVDVGPGSFTGLRIGVTCAKTLSFATKKPLKGVSSLDILASAIEERRYQICPIIDAKRQNVYSCLYERNDKGLKKITPYLLVNFDKLLKRINKKTMFVGDALKLYKTKIIQQKKRVSFFAKEEFWYPKIENLSKIADIYFKKGYFDNPDSLVPIYLYPKECQIRKT